MKNSRLWTNIKNFTLDDPDCEFSFSQRLARDNNWSLAFSQQVILEYKKFMYLCCVGYGELTPSDAVDQAWHLHLTYTKSYWIAFCEDTLGKQIHHNPTQGGSEEKSKYSSCYANTLRAYEDEFGEKPPEEVWLQKNKRFAQLNFKRINLSEYWLIRKSNLNYSYLFAIATALVVGLFVQSDNPIPLFSLGLVFLLIMLLVRTIRGKGSRSRKNGGSNEGDSSWGGFWDCSSDDSGCSSHGCSSGCSGCGGGD
ncbi:hypothetical protein PZB74_12665 [Porifericola rhodea]|uniref:glycine-rich domain-containing protein n=1 Tax=Porifericola rhodea TaxID=930972 RepID=UPI00266589DA|nr:hypothetical protein [Porifericola rhodea]WKN29819.1 hypothetical protein PZB74_12665 [Porifericola rhodea]